MTARPRVVVVGGGPAGVMATVQAGRLGMDVTLVDENATVGGQYFRARQDSEAAGSPRYLAAHGSGARVLGATSVIDAPAHGRLTIWSAGRGADDLEYDHLVICTGAYDRTIALPGWTLPGVMTAGAAHTLAKGHGVTAGKRIIVAGAGPFLLPVADALTAAGCRVTIVEASPFHTSVAGLPTLARDPEVLFQALGYLGRLGLRRTRPSYGRTVTAIHGHDRVEAVTIAKVDADWRPLPGTEATIEADGVCLGFGFVPQLDLAQLVGCSITYDREASEFAIATDAGLRTSLPHVYAAGEATGIGGVRVAVLQGRLAALSAAQDAGLLDGASHEGAVSTVHARLRRRARVAGWIRRAYAPRPGLWSLATPDTIVCRCEDVTRDAAESALVATDPTPVGVKTATRAGMGLCQGRICSPYIAEWLRDRHGFVPPANARPWSVRPPIRPVPLEAWPSTSAGGPA